MNQQKKRKLDQTSLYEAIRVELGLEKYQLAQLLGQTRQWYTRKKNPLCTMTTPDLWKLYKVSGMTPEEFVRAIQKAAAER
jgi:hypothetical protein